MAAKTHELHWFSAVLLIISACYCFWRPVGWFLLVIAFSKSPAGWGVPAPGLFYLCMMIEVCASLGLFICAIALLLRSRWAISLAIVASALIILQHLVLLATKSHALETEFLNSQYTVNFWIVPIILGISCIVSLLLARQKEGWLSDPSESSETPE